MVTINISDVPKSIQYDSLTISESVSNRSEANFEIIVNTIDDIKSGNPVDIFTEDYTLFTGRVKNINIKANTIGGELRAKINCVDYNHVLDRILVAEEYVNKSLYYIVNDIYNKYLINEWLAVFNYPSNDIIIEKAVFSYISISDCFKYLCNETAYNYTIDTTGFINFFYRDDLTTNTIYKSDILDIDLDIITDDYRNRQFIKGGYDETTVTNEVLTPKPDGNTTTFFSRYPLGTVPTVKVDNTTVSSSSVGIDGIDTDKWFYWNKNVNKLSQNTQMLATLSSGTVSMDYKGLVKILVQADNVEGQTEMADNETSDTVWGTGIYSNILEVGSIQTKNEAINYANGLLQKYNKIPKSINITSTAYREIGRTVFLDYIEFTNELLFIESKETYLVDGELRFDYKLLNGQSLGNWTEFFRKIYKQGQDMLINEDVTLVKLQTQPEYWNMVGDEYIETFTPVYLADDLYISESLTLGDAINGKWYFPTFIADNLLIGDSLTLGTITDSTIVRRD